MRCFAVAVRSLYPIRHAEGAGRRGRVTLNKDMAAPALTVKELERFLAAEFPQVFNADSGVSIDEAWHGGCRVRQAYKASSIRPGIWAR